MNFLFWARRNSKHKLWPFHKKGNYLPRAERRQAKYGKCNEDVEQVIDSQGEHQLVEVPLDLGLAEPEDGQAVASDTKQANQDLPAYQI